VRTLTSGIINSIANITPPMGVLNVAAIPAPAPAATKVIIPAFRSSRFGHFGQMISSSIIEADVRDSRTCDKCAPCRDELSNEFLRALLFFSGQ
jgi:hypothetical protein